jgi:3-phenylpropionate/trans-cinnamate dioxygenase ferredoxin subunit
MARRGARAPPGFKYYFLEIPLWNSKYEENQMDQNSNQWIEIAPLEDLTDINTGESFSIDIENDDGIKKSVLLVKGSLKWYAVDNLCSHDNGPLGDGIIDLQNCSVQCGRHGAKFNLASGEVLSMPAITPIGSYELKEENGILFIKI